MVLLWIAVARMEENFHFTCQFFWMLESLLLQLLLLSKSGVGYFYTVQKKMIGVAKIAHAHDILCDWRHWLWGLLACGPTPSSTSLWGTLTVGDRDLSKSMLWTSSQAKFPIGVGATIFICIVGILHWAHAHGWEAAPPMVLNTVLC